MLRKIILFVTSISTVFVFAQNGEQVYSFLNIPVSARQAALGGDAISIRDFDVSFAGINPGLMNLEMDKRVSLNYASYLAGSQLGTLSYVHDLEYGHLLAFNARYMNYGNISRTDESGGRIGDFSAVDTSVGVGYAYQFEDNWTIGGNINLITSKIDTYSSLAVSGSAGVTYHNNKDKETLALVFRNFGYQLSPFNGVRERMPFRVDLGFTKILREIPLALTVTAHDLQQLDISSAYNVSRQETTWGRKIADHFSFGAELFPEQAFNLRIGYNVKRGNELAILDQRSFAGLSFGFGLKISSFRFDYSHVRYNGASNVNMLGLNIDLIEITGRRR